MENKDGDVGVMVIVMIEEGEVVGGVCVGICMVKVKNNVRGRFVEG